MLKNLFKILCAIFFIAAFSLSSTTLNKKGRHFDRSFVMGLGPNFDSNGAIGLFQLGAAFSVFRENNFDFQVGPLVNIGFNSRNTFFDFDLFFKANYDFQVLEKYSLSLYGKVPVGYSLVVANTLAHGMNFGIIPGAAFNLTERFGIFGELGLLHRIFFLKRGTLQAPTGTANFGIIYKF